MVRESEDGRQLEKVMTDTAGSGGGAIDEAGSGISSTNANNQSSASENNSSSGYTAENNSGDSTSPTTDRQNSTSRGDGDRLFRFNIDFDSSRRQLQALTMIQEWARNNVNLSIPSLGSSASNEGGPSTSGPGRDRLAHRTQTTDTHISMPMTSGQAAGTSSSSNSNVPASRTRSSPTNLHLHRLSSEHDTENSTLLSQWIYDIFNILKFIVWWANNKL